MTYVWKPREDGISFREGAHESNVCGKSATGDYTCTRPKGHAGWHIASGIDGAYEVWPDGVFVPVPDGVAYDDALRAVNDARPWVEWDVDKLAPAGARVRAEWVQASQSGTYREYVHPDDVPDPDADLIERMARANHEAQFISEWGSLHEETREQAREGARAALAVIREGQS